MKTATILLLASVVVLPRAVEAQTLDELHHPLLAPARVAATGEYEFYAVEHMVGSIGGPLEMTYFQPQYVLFPQIRAGLARNLEIRLDGTNQFPTRFADPFFPGFTEGGHAFYTTTIRSIAGSAVFRPRADLELRGSYAWGRSRDDLTYSRSPVTEIYDSNTGTTGVASIAGTWLSHPDANSRPLRADLDGLHHPLLARGRWTIDGELMRRSFEYGYRSTGDPTFNVEHTGRSIDARLWLGVGHGLANGMQLHADGYWHPPFRIADTSQATSTRMGRTTVTTTPSQARYEGVFGWRLNAVWRPSQRAELFAEGAREQEGVAHDSVSRTGAVETSRTTTIRVGAAWLSRRPTRSTALAGDLAGLYHPLVEPGQLKLDGLVDHVGYRGERFAPSSWLWRVQATTGVWGWMQATAYGGMIIVRMAPSPFTDTSKMPTRFKSMGAQLTMRLFGRVDAFGSLHLRPAGFFTAYPVFILGRDDPYAGYRDVLAKDLGGDRTLHVGLRFVM